MRYGRTLISVVLYSRSQSLPCNSFSAVFTGNGRLTIDHVEWSASDEDAKTNLILDTMQVTTLHVHYY